jgi:hypothetical protein
MLGGETGLLEEWMAHYISERLKRLRDVRDDADSERIKAEIADLITRLWRLICDKKSHAVAYNLTAFRSLTSLGPELRMQLGAFISGSGSVPNEPSEWLEWYRALPRLEERLLGVWAVSQGLAETPEAVFSEAWAVLIGGESSSKIVERLAEVFPLLAELDLTDKATVDRRIKSALQSLADLRAHLLGVMIK